jgi:copper chaperone CopZ
VHSTYGIARVRVEPSLEKLTVDYDASRLMEREVESILTRHGIPIHTAAIA